MAAPPPLAQETVWTDKSKFEDAEAQFHAQQAKPLEQPVAVPESQQPLQVSNQNDQGTVEVQPDPNPVAQETATEQPPPASVPQDPQPVPEVVVADASPPAPAQVQVPEAAEQVPVAVGTEKPAQVCPHLEKEKKKDDAEDPQPLPDTNVKEKKQKKAKTSNVKEPVAEEPPQQQQPEEQTVAKDSQAQQQASSKGEKKQKEKQAGKEKEKVQSEKGGKQKKQAKDKQVNKDEAIADNVVAAVAVAAPASADQVAEAQTESRKKGKKKEEKQDGGEEKKSSQKAGKKGKHGDKVVESTPPVVDVAIKEKAESSQKARTGTCNGKSSLTDEIARARLHIKSSLQSVDALPKAAKEQSPEFVGRLGKLEEENKKLNKVIDNLQGLVLKLESRVALLEAGGLKPTAPPTPVPASKPSEAKSAPAEKSEDDDDVDLFGASDEDDAEKERLHQERVKAYAEKKSKKPALIAKSSVILDVKPWDDETDMKEMERLVREIQMEGLVWGASKLVPLAFGIHKLQLCCVVEDEKVSIDELQERIQEIEQFVQSADVAAFNKV